MRTIFACLALLCVVNCGGQVPPGGPTMSTPMFIREPLAFGLAAVSGAGFAEIVPEAAEATMIEEVRYMASLADTTAGRISMLIRDVAGGGTTYLLPDNAITATAGSGLYASGTITLNLTVPVGWSLEFAAADIQNAAPGDTTVYFVALGGILR